MWIGHRNESIRSDEGLTLETSALESAYRGQFTLSTKLISQIILLYSPPTQHHSFFRNLSPSPPNPPCLLLSAFILFGWYKVTCGIFLGVLLMIQSCLKMVNACFEWTKMKFRVECKRLYCRRSPLLGAYNYLIFLSRRFHRPIYNYFELKSIQTPARTSVTNRACARKAAIVFRYRCALMQTGVELFRGKKA